MGYRYLGDPNNDGLHTYEVTLTTYQDCNSQNWWTVGGTFPVPTATIGIYEGLLQGSFLFQTDILNLTLSDSTLVRTGSTDSCFIPINNYCVYKVDYTGTIDLPATSLGYHFVYDVCCRGNAYPTGNGPNNISLFGNVGSVNHAWTGPTTFANSSPIFDTLDPYICINDTNLTRRPAVDPDGDSLFFRLVAPYDGTGNNASSPPPNIFTFPILDTVNYIAGHSTKNPLGPGGYAEINPFTGQGKYFGTTTGIYVLQVQIIEYSSSGGIVGVSGYEFQYIVAPCQNRGPKNTADPTLTGQNLNFNVEEGDTICIDVEYFDPDSLQVLVGLESDSNIFSSNFFSPPATIGPQSYDPVTAISSREVCWVTNCGMGRPASFEFTSFAIDSGCPNRSAENIYKIKIDEFDVPGNIQGAVIACPTVVLNYSVDSVFGATYNWNITNGNILSGQGTNNVSVLWTQTADSGSIAVTPISRFGCSAPVKELEVDIVQMVSINAGTDTNLCGHDTITLGGSPTGPTYYTYAWNNLQYLSDDSVQNPVAFTDTTLLFIVTAYDTTGCTIADSVNINVTKNNLDAGPNLYVCPGDSVQIVASGAATYSWTPNTNLTNSNISNPIAYPLDTTFYNLTGNINNCTFFDTLRIDVDSIVPSYLPDFARGCFGDSLDIGGSPTGPKYTTFKWTPNNNITNDTAANPNYFGNVSTSFFLELFNGQCFGYDTISVQIDSLPNVVAGNDTAICQNDSIVLIGSGDSLISGRWLHGNGILIDSSFTTKSIVSTTESLLFIGVNKNGCENIDSLILTAKPLPSPSFNADTILCFGDTLNLNAGPGKSFSWSPNSFIDDSTAQIVKIYPADTTEYRVEIEGNNDCFGYDTILVNVTYLNATVSPDTFICPGDTLQLFTTGGLLYRWSDGNKLSNDSVANPRAFPIKTTNFLVTISDGIKCQSIDSVLVEVSESNFLVDGRNRIICYGDTVSLQSQGLQNFEWLPNQNIDNNKATNPKVFPTDTVIYVVAGTDSNNCFNTDSVLINVLPRPPANAGTDTNICRGDTAFIGANFIQGLTYSWSPSEFLNNSLVPNPNAAVKERTQFILTVTDQFNCSWSDSVFVNVFDILSPTDTVICTESGATINARPLFGTPPFTYNWSPSYNLSDSAIANPVLLEATSITYRVIVQDSTGCADTTFSDVTKAQKPTAEFTPKFYPACEDMSITFINESDDITSFYWVINGDTTVEDYPQITIPYSQSLNAQLYVSGIEGCTDTTELNQVLELFDDYVNVEIANIFTPNGDGFNDFFEFPLENKLMPCTDFEVYNRWGALMFKSQGNVHSWDGTTFDGSDVPEGIYFYTLKVNSLEWKGSVHLIR